LYVGLAATNKLYKSKRAQINFMNYKKSVKYPRSAGGAVEVFFMISHMMQWWTAFCRTIRTYNTNLILSVSACEITTI